MKNPNIAISRAINRFERAVKRKACGPTPQQAQLDAHIYIKREYALAKARLRAMLEGRVR